jgi:hypothetical protein
VVRERDTFSFSKSMSVVLIPAEKLTRVAQIKYLRVVVFQPALYNPPAGCQHSRLNRE